MRIALFALVAMLTRMATGQRLLPAAVWSFQGYEVLRGAHSGATPAAKRWCTSAAYPLLTPAHFASPASPDDGVACNLRVLPSSPPPNVTVVQPKTGGTAVTPLGLLPPTVGGTTLSLLQPTTDVTASNLTQPGPTQATTDVAASAQTPTTDVAAPALPSAVTKLGLTQRTTDAAASALTPGVTKLGLTQPIADVATSNLAPTVTKLGLTQPTTDAAASALTPVLSKLVLTQPTTDVAATALTPAVTKVGLLPPTLDGSTAAVQPTTDITTHPLTQPGLRQPGTGGATPALHPTSDGAEPMSAKVPSPRRASWTAPLCAKPQQLPFLVMCDSDTPAIVGGTEVIVSTAAVEPAAGTVCSHAASLSRPAAPSGVIVGNDVAAAHIGDANVVWHVNTTADTLVPAMSGGMFVALLAFVCYISCSALRMLGKANDCALMSSVPVYGTVFAASEAKACPSSVSAAARTSTLPLSPVALLWSAAIAVWSTGAAVWPAAATVWSTPLVPLAMGRRLHCSNRRHSCRSGPRTPMGLFLLAFTLPVAFADSPCTPVNTTPTLLSPPPWPHTTTVVVSTQTAISSEDGGSGLSSLNGSGFKVVRPVDDSAMPPPLANLCGLSVLLACVVLSFQSRCPRRHSMGLSLLFAVVLLSTTATASGVCTHVTAPPNAEVIDVCAPPWPRTPTEAPTAGTNVTIDIVFASGTTGLTASSATVNGAGVAASFVEDGGGTYSLTFATQVGDENWPWSGLHIHLEVSDGSVFAAFDATLVTGSTWSKESDARGMSQSGGSGSGVCMGDVDGDGDVDVFRPRVSGNEHQLWINDGSGVFVNDASSWGVSAVSSGNTVGCGFSDANGDGLLDLFVTRYEDDVNELYINTGSAFVEDGAAWGVSSGNDNTGLSTGDVNGDGLPDVFVCSDNARVNRLYLNQGGNMFSEEGASRGVGTLARPSRQSALVDIDGDGDLDVLVVNDDPNELYVNDGSGVFAEAGTSRGFSDSGNGLGLAVGDWSGDGIVDVYVSNADNGDMLYVNDGSGTFSEVGVATGVGASPAHSVSVAMFDIEADGDVDIIVGGSGSDFVWMNDGAGHFTDLNAALLPLQFYGFATGDVDGDGDVDVISSFADAYVNHNAQSGVSRVVVVRPLTLVGGQSAFGAMVRVACVAGCVEDWVGVRVIDGGSGRYSQQGYDAIVGVPVPSATYNVSVRWPADFHPSSNWMTHARLGGVMPSSLPAIQDRLFVVRPAPVTLSVKVLPWDYPAVTVRSGLDPSAPVAGDEHAVIVVVSPWVNAHDVRVVSAVVSGQNVAASLSAGANGTFEVTYETEAGKEDWPWLGLDIVVVVVDGGGLLSSVSTSVVVGSTWSEESDARGISALAGGYSRGVCMGDVDGDGDMDMFVAMESGSMNQLWINNGSGVFRDESSLWEVGGAASDHAFGCSFGDADGDGLLDLLVTRSTDDVIELYMNVGGTFVEEGGARGVSVGDDSLGVSWGDVDGDGDVDLFVCISHTNVNILYVNDGTGVFTEEGVSRGVGTLARTSRQSALVDIDDDGDLDVLVVNSGANELYVNGGGGVFVEAGAGRGFAAAGNAHGVAVGDWSGDGVVDVYVPDDNSRDMLYLNDGSGVFSEIGVSVGMGDSGGRSRGAVIFDIENDGDVDVVVAVVSGADLVWVNAGGSVQGTGRLELALGSTATEDCALAGDVDGDGDMDVIMAEQGNVFVSHTSQAGVSRVLVIRPLSSAGGLSVFSASVRAQCVGGCSDAWVGLRVVDGGSNLYSQSGYDAVVGVPVPSATYNVSVRWPADFHPPSNWMTHPRLGGIVPSTLASASDRTFVVRPSPVQLSLKVLPWDFPAVAARSGLELSAPVAGDTHTVSVAVSPWVNARDVTVVSAVVSGKNVTGSLIANAVGTFEVTYVTEEGNEEWPWAGLEVDVVAVDGGGLVSTVSTSIVAGSTWSEESDARGMSALATTNGRGVCTGDVDGDGDVDIFAAMRSGNTSQLWLNDGSGVFMDEALAWGVAGVAADTAHSCGFGDADGDGQLDLMVTRDTDDVNELYANTGRAYEEDGVARGVSVGADSRGVSWGDVDGDGDLDLFVCNGAGTANMLYINDGAGVFSEEGESRGVGTSRSSHRSALVDIDSDADLDVLVVNAAAANELHLNDGGGMFSEAGSDRGFNDGHDARGMAVCDWSGDGVVDVYVSNDDSRDLLYVNDGNGVFSEVGVDAGVGTSVGAGHGVSTFDIEADGDVDIIVGVWGGPDLVWSNNGGGGFSDGRVELVLGRTTTASGLAAGDVDGDGDVDVIMGYSGTVFVNHNARAGSSRVVVVRPLTASGGQSAFGATVRVLCVVDCAVDWTGLRVLDGGSSWHSQNGYDAVVGVPVPTATYNISVRWPADFHPLSNWTTHPRLGGIVPSMFNSPNDRLFVVRPSPVQLSLNVLPWDYPAVAARRGLDPSAPVADDTHTISVVVSPWPNAGDLRVSAVVNGQDVSETWTSGSNGTFQLTYETEENNENWPWSGLDIDVVVVDGSGLISSVSTSIVVGSTWSEESDARGMSGLADSDGRGVCMGDVDADGDVDVFVAMASGTPNQLWINDGSGVFAEEAVSWGVAGSASDPSRGCGFGDADGNGLLDLLVTRYTADVNVFYLNNGSVFVEDGAARGVSIGDDSFGVSWGDVDGDGDVDLFVCNRDNKVNMLYVNDGAGVFAEQGGVRGVGTLTRPSFQSVLVDIDGDSDLDVLVVNFGVNELYVNAGAGMFVEAGTEHGFSDGSTGEGIGVGDWNGDGAVDVYVSNTDTRDLMYVNDDSGVFTEVGVAAGVGASTGYSRGVVMFDVEGDGDLDVTVGVDSAADLAFLNDGDSFTAGSASLMLGSTAGTIGVCAGDIDGDGDVDVIMGYFSGTVFINHNAQPQVSRSIMVRPLTLFGAQSAFGTQVGAQCVDRCASEWVGLRVIDGGSGYFSQNAYDAHIGVPVPTAAYNISVRWSADFHPPSNWTTHPRLGGVVPSSFTSPSDRLFIVRPAPVVVSLGLTLPWDYAAVTVRTGSPSPPVVGDTVSIPITVPRHALDLTASSATVNGQNVRATFAFVEPGSYTLLYTTVAGQEDWPWAGLSVSLTATDSGGLQSTLSASVLVGTTMENAATSTGLGAMDPQTSGICMGDGDGDGDMDIVTNFDNGRQLFLNAGDGTFLEADGALASDSGSTGCALADVDNDGDLDVVASPFGDGVNMLFVQDADNVFAEDGPARGLTSEASDGRGVAVGDIDGDGDVDVYVCAGGGTNQLYVNDGTGHFTRELRAASPAASMQAVMFDMDGDADLDLAVVNDGTADELYVNDGEGNLAERGALRGFSDDGSARSVAVGDMNGDGFLDIVVTRNSARDLLYINSGSGTFVEEGAQRGVILSTNVLSVAIMDWDNDGDLDLLMPSAGDVDVVWLNTGGGHFVDWGSQLGASSGATVRVASSDIDGDGDVDVVTSAGSVVYRNHNAQPDVANWIKVRVFTSGGAPSAFGALVQLACVVGCDTQPWSGLRSVVGGDAHFGLPDWGTAFDLSVAFVGGATHDKTTDPRLGGVVGRTTVDVVDRPYLTSVAAIHSDSGALGVNDSVVLTLTAGRGWRDLVPAPTCCFVNGVQVRDTFASDGDGTYNLTYLLKEGDPEWPAGGLPVVPTLRSASTNLTMVEVRYTLKDSPAGDPVSPVIVLDCAPAVASANVWEPVCVSCPAEARCTFSYVVESTTLQHTAAGVPAANYTSTSSAAFVVGPFNDSDTASLTVFAVDGADNTAASSPIAWRVDTSSPVTTLIQKPDPVTQRTGATFTLQCSEASCSFAYQFDGGPLTSLGGNTTSVTDVPVMDTVLMMPPDRVSNITAPWVVFGVHASTPDMLVNASVAVELGSQHWTLPVVGNATQPLRLPPLTDGTYALSGTATSGDAVTDVTPIRYVFTVDTRPPTATIVKAPEDGDPSALATVVVGADEDCTFLWRSGPVPVNSSWQLSAVGVMRPSVDTSARHVFEVRPVDAAGNIGDVVSVSWTPSSCPHTVPDVAVTSSLRVGDGHRYVAFAGDGVDVFEYRVDGGQWVHTTDHDVVLADVELGLLHTLDVRAAVPAVCNTHLSGSRPPPRSVTWREPARLPLEVTIVDAPDAVTPDVFAEFAMVASRRLAWLEYSLDGEAWAPCEEMLLVGPLQAGDHTMRVRAVDKDGGGSGVIQSHTWTISAASDSSIVLSGLPDGVHTMTVIATDDAGSFEVAPNTFTWRVDTVPPIISGNRTTRRFTTSRTAVVDVLCEGEIDPCTFCWTSDTVGNNCSDVSPVLMTAPSDGHHAADVRAVDSVELASETSVDVLWTVDSTPPSMTIGDPDDVLVAPLYDMSSVDAVAGLRTVRLNLTANEPVEGFAVTLNGGEWPSDGAGLLTESLPVFSNLPSIINAIRVSTTDLSGSVGDVVELRLLVDTTPPDGTTFTTALPTLTKAASLPVVVACSDTPGGSGVRHIVVYVNGVAVGSVDGPSGTHTLSGLTTGVYNVSVAGVDVAGNVDDSPAWHVVTVDQVSPVSSFVRVPATLSSSPFATVWITANEDATLFARVANETEWLPANASGVVTFAGLPDGRHSLQLRATDVAGNVEAEPYTSAPMTVDTVPPVTAGVVVGDGVVVVGEHTATPHTFVAVNVSANEAVAGYQVWVDGIVQESLASGPTIDVENLDEGVRNVTVAAVDVAGNADPTPPALSVWVDLTPPVASWLVTVPPSPTRASTLSFGVEGEDVAGGVGLAHLVVSATLVDSATTLPDTLVPGAAGTATIAGVTTGVYNVSVAGVDGVGNVDVVPAWNLVEVDQVPPVSSFVSLPSAFSPLPVVTVWINANENASLYAHVPNRTQWLPANASGAVTFSGLSDGPHTVQLRAVDVAGNDEVEPYATAVVVVDTRPPVLFWTTPPPAYTNTPLATGCFAANDSNAVTFTIAPSAATLSSSDCFELDVAADGTVTVNVMGTDAAGNVGLVLSTSWVLDRVAPTVVVDSPVSASPACVHDRVTVCNTIAAATLQLSCSDGVTGVDVSPCRPQYAVALVEGATAAGCVAPRRLSVPDYEDAASNELTVLQSNEGDGLYAVSVRAVDAAGNMQTSNTTMTWYVDSIAPVRPTFVQQPDAIVSTDVAIFVVQLVGDNSAGQLVFWYALDDGTATAATDLPTDVSDDVQLEFRELSGGNHKVEVWAVDQGGKTGSSVLHNWQIVTDAPSITILEQPAAVSGDVKPSFVFAARWPDRPAHNASEPAASVEVSLNGAADYSPVCSDTLATGGICVWNASLAERGVGSYTINARARLAGKVGNPTPFAWQYTLCGDDAYAVVGGDGGISCIACPDGGNCAGGLTGQTDIAALGGWWAPQDSTGLRFYACPVEEACLPGGDLTTGNTTTRLVSQCAEGYTGTLCAVCADGYFQQFGLCESCGTQSGVAWLIMFAVLLTVIAVAILFFRYRELVPIDQLKVTLSMVQIVASANTAYAIPWPPLFADFLNTMRVFLIEAVSLTRANCAQSMTFYGSLTVTLVAFKIVLLVVVLGPVALHKCKQRGRQHTMPPVSPPRSQRSQRTGSQRRERRRSSLVASMVSAVHAAQAMDWAKIFKITFLFLFVAYPGVSLKIMTIFKCVEVEGQHWLVADMRLKCYEGDWYGYALYAFIMGCLYTGGLPLAITVILFKNRRKLVDAGVVAKWGFLYQTYGVHAYLWEVAELLRKLWLSALVVLMAEGSPLQVTVAVLISGWAHVMHALYKPWQGGGDGGTYVYALQHGSLLVTFFVFLMGLLFKVNGVSQDGTTYTLLAWVMLLACVAFLVAACIVLIVAGRAQLRALRRKKVVAGVGRGQSRRTTVEQISSWNGGSAPGNARSASMPHPVRAAASRQRGMSWVGNPLQRKQGLKSAEESDAPPQA